MSNQQQLNELRKGYTKISTSLIQGQLPDENILKKQRASAIKITNKANQNEIYTNIQQLVHYRKIYDKLIEMKNKDKQKPFSKEQIKNHSKLILDAEPQQLKSFIKQSIIKEDTVKITPYLSNQQPQPVINLSSNSKGQQSNAINKKSTFFDERKSKIQSTMTFREALNIPNLPSGQYNFKKKSRISKNSALNNPNYQSELNSLRQQNSQLKQLINGSHENLSRKIQEKEKRIQQLQQQIRYITIDNQRLRENQLSSEKSPIYSHYNIQPYCQNFQNYNLNPLNNDLQAISSQKSDFIKNSKVSNYGLQQDKNYPNKYQEVESVNNYKIGEKMEQIHSERNVNQRNKQEGGYRNMNSLLSIERQGDFDSFSMGNPGFSIIKNTTKQYGIKDPATCSRNKAAFFKNSLVIVKDQDYQIAFKKSNINTERDQLRLIFYIYNKTFNHQRVNIQYIDESRNYAITVKQKLTELQANSRGRQDILIKLNNNFELTSIIDAYFKVGDRTYELWIPANFIQFDSRYRDLSRTTEIVTIKPDRVFANYQTAISLLQLANKQIIKNQVIANMYGNSRCHQGAVKLTWRLDGKLDIQTSDRWVDYLGFLLCKIR